MNRSELEFLVRARKPEFLRRALALSGEIKERKPSEEQAERARELFMYLYGGDFSVRWGDSETGRVKMSELPYDGLVNAFYHVLRSAEGGNGK